MNLMISDGTAEKSKTAARVQTWRLCQGPQFPIELMTCNCTELPDGDYKKRPRLKARQENASPLAVCSYIYGIYILSNLVNI